MPNLHIGVIAHGDYDSDSYVTKYIDLSNDVTALQGFVRGVDNTVGWTVPECYELILKEAREKISWRPGSQRAVVMIGDTVPHDQYYYASQKNLRCIDWKEELTEIKKTVSSILHISSTF